MQSIPYDPSLVLGNIVEKPTLDRVKAISDAGGPADAAKDKLNALILAKRSLGMTIQELMGMGINPEAVAKSITKLDQDITQAAGEYATATIASQTQIATLKGAKAAIPVTSQAESPINYMRSALKGLPISADTFQMDAQYFNADKNQQSSGSTQSAVSGFVAASLSFLGDQIAAQVSTAAQKQMNEQYSRHDIAGTLVITAGATHKQAQVWAPLVIDPDKAIRIWNTLHADKKLNPLDPASMAKAMLEATGNDDDLGLRIISGATYGSSFVGMVHVLNTAETRSSEQMYSVAESAQAQLTITSWYKAYVGGGEASSMAQDVKNLLSKQDISSHCSLVTMGIIPSIKSNDGPKVAVQFLEEFDGGKKLAALQNSTAGDQATVATKANQVMNGTMIESLQASKVQAALGTLQKADYTANRMLDINSMITAFDDYVQKCISGGQNVGVPITYYLKTITRSELAQLWINKYYPGRYVVGGDDDQVAGGPAAAGGATAGGAPATGANK